MLQVPPTVDDRSPASGCQRERPCPGSTEFRLHVRYLAQTITDAKPASSASGPRAGNGLIDEILNGNQVDWLAVICRYRMQRDSKVKGGKIVPH